MNNQVVENTSLIALKRAHPMALLRVGTGTSIRKVFYVSSITWPINAVTGLIPNSIYFFLFISFFLFFSFLQAKNNDEISRVDASDDVVHRSNPFADSSRRITIKNAQNSIHDAPRHGIASIQRLVSVVRAAGCHSRRRAARQSSGRVQDQQRRRRRRKQQPKFFAIFIFVNRDLVVIKSKYRVFLLLLLHHHF